MKKLINLQLFAEEAQTETQTETQQQTEEPKKQDAKPEKKYSDDDIDRILGQKFAEWQKKKDKEVSEAQRLAKMTEEEKSAENLKALEKRLADYEKREARNEMTKQARAILLSENVNVSDELVSLLVADNAETTKAAVENFVKLHKAEVEKAVKEALKSETPRKGGTSGMTKEQILAVTNRVERQRLISENMHLFK